MGVAGAKYLSGIGVELYKLALLARWSSPIIMRYVGEAPLATVTSDCRKLLAGAQLHTLVEDLNRKVEQNLVRLESIAVLPQSSLTAEARSPHGRHLYSANSICIRNDESLIWHFSLGDKTACGWTFDVTRTTSSRGLPADVKPRALCDRCFPAVRTDSMLARKPKLRDSAAPTVPGSDESAADSSDDETSDTDTTEV